MRSRLTKLVCCIATASVVALFGCRTQTRKPSPGAPNPHPIVAMRDVRVLVADGHRRCRVRADAPLRIKDDRDRVRFESPGGEWLVIGVDADRNIRCGDTTLGRGVYALYTDPGVAIRLAVAKGQDWSPPRRYAGALRLRLSPSDRLRVVNYVDVETYVACVLPGEIFPHFDRQAYLAQVVAARTYVLFQMARKSGAPYDVASTEASQVYPGLGSGDSARRAREAADATRGIVATWTSPYGERIFCTFYSSCCGGRTQDVANCRKDVPSIPPLAGGVRCDCLKVAKGKSYQWGSVRLSKSDITAKLVARYPAFNDLGRVAKISIVDRTRWGRPKTLRIHGRSGKSRDLASEDFRLAVGSRALRSTNFRIRTTRENIEFTGGVGFGHGMGMCQWGMQEMALRGFSAAKILKHYYPTMNLTRAY